MYSQVITDLTRAGIPVRELHGNGHVAVIPAAGRILALAFSKAGPNLLWSNPALGDTALVKATPEKLVGGFGGERLWFAPELRYHWLGEPDWRGLKNYQVPPDTDPGRYAFFDVGPDVVALTGMGRLPVRGSEQYLDFAVERRIRLTEPPLPFNHPQMRGVDFAGVETAQTLTIDKGTRSGEIDLWHILQLPVGSVLVVPLRCGRQTEPLSYGLPGTWQVTPTALVWRFEGSANAKIGIAAAALTGRAAALRRLEADRWCLIIRQFPVDPAARYGDYPNGVPRADQVFQAWDGMGVGEMEYHSPVLDAEQGPRTWQDQDYLWAFGGSTDAITALADSLLHVDVRSFLTQAAVSA